MNDLGGKAYYHLPGLFEFYELYRVFLPLFREHRAYFYDWCEIGSIYGAPADCIWGGGRAGFGDQSAKEVLALLREYGISAGSPSAIHCCRRNICATRNAMPCVRCLKRAAACRMGSSSTRSCCWNT